MGLTGSNGPDQPPRRRSVEERLAWLEARAEHVKWWRTPGWWGVILSAVVGLSGLVWQTQPWELFQDDAPPKRVGTVKLIEGHASAFAKNEWDADLRVVNETSRDIVVERVFAIFGARRYGQSCRRGGKATRVLYPESQLRSGSARDLFQRVHPGEGAPFKGSRTSTACSEASDHVRFPWRNSAPGETRSPSSSLRTTAPSGRPKRSSSMSLVLASGVGVACPASRRCRSVDRLGYPGSRPTNGSGPACSGQSAASHFRAGHPVLARSQWRPAQPQLGAPQARWRTHGRPS